MEESIGVFGEELLLWICMLRQAPRCPPATEVHRQANLLFDELKSSPAAMALPVVSVDDAMFAIAALLDESAMALPDLRPVWATAPLQATRWMTNNAGVEVFDRLQRARQGPRSVLATYVAVLGIGFLGKYALPGADRYELARMRRQLSIEIGVDADRDQQGGVLQLIRSEAAPSSLLSRDPWWRSVASGRVLMALLLLGGGATLAWVLYQRMSWSAAATELAAIAAAAPNQPRGVYSLPWYLVVGDLGAGRSTAIRAMNLSWPRGESPLRLGLPRELCSCWLAGEAVLLEPEAPLMGQGADGYDLRSYGEALRRIRPREPVDGMILVISAKDVIDLDERGLEAHARRLRGYLVTLGQGMRADVPVYVVVTRYDTLWGFAEAFQWTPERRGEPAWGFVLPGETTPKQAPAAIRAQMGALTARFEAFCFAKVSSEDPPDHRARAFQHWCEARALLGRIGALMDVLAMENAFERAPWIRALCIGCGVPGTGDRPRAGVARFSRPVWPRRRRAIPRVRGVCPSTS